MKRLAFMPRDSLLSALNLLVTEKVRQVKPPVKHLYLTSQINSQISLEDLHSSPTQTPRQEGKNALDLIPLSAVYTYRLIPWHESHVDYYKLHVPCISLFFRFSAVIRTSGLCITVSVTSPLVYVWWCHLQELTDVNWT